MKRTLTWLCPVRALPSRGGPQPGPLVAGRRAASTGVSSMIGLKRLDLHRRRQQDIKVSLVFCLSLNSARVHGPEVVAFERVS